MWIFTHNPTRRSSNYTLQYHRFFFFFSRVNGSTRTRIKNVIQKWWLEIAKRVLFLLPVYLMWIIIALKMSTCFIGPAFKHRKTHNTKYGWTKTRQILSKRIWLLTSHFVFINGCQNKSYETSVRFSYIVSNNFFLLLLCLAKLRCTYPLHCMRGFNLNCDDVIVMHCKSTKWQIK